MMYTIRSASAKRQRQRARLRGALGAAILAIAPLAAAAQQPPPDVPALLREARLRHEPTRVIEAAVLLLDQQLDADPTDKKAWLHLGEALAIGIAKSEHAATPFEAWRTAYELDKSDCHAGALAARSAPHALYQSAIADLARSHPECAEAVYLRALAASADDPSRVADLRRSLALRPSAEAYAELGQALAVAGDWEPAELAFQASLASPTLFPEDWRPDGCAAVHGHLGLAWVHVARSRWSDARREYVAFMSWFAVPGPWHGLSEAEEMWRKRLETRWPEVGRGHAK